MMNDLRIGLWSCVAIVAVLCQGACATERDSPDPSAEAGAEDSTALRVLAAEVEGRSLRETTQRSVTVEAGYARELRAPVSGTLRRGLARDDARGGEVARVESDELSTRIRVLRSQLARERDRFARYEALHADGVLTTEEWIEAQRHHEALRREVSLAEAAHDVRRLRVSPGTRVVRWIVPDGEDVSAGELLARLQGGESHLVSLAVNPVEVDFWRDASVERRCGSVGEWLAVPAEVVRDSEIGPGWWLELYLDGDDPCAAEGRRVSIRALGEEKSRVVVPVRAVVHDPDGSWLWRVDEEGRLERVEIEVMRAVDGGVAVRGELHEGELVVADEPRSLRAEDRVDAVTRR